MERETRGISREKDTQIIERLERHIERERYKRDKRDTQRDTGRLGEIIERHRETGRDNRD